MGKKSTPELQPAQKKTQETTGNIPAQEAPGKMPPQFNLSAEPVQAKFEDVVEGGKQMLQSGWDWLSSFWSGGDEPQTADKVDASAQPQLGDAPGKEGAAGGQQVNAPAAEDKGKAPVTPVVADKGKAPVTPVADTSKGAATPEPVKQEAAPTNDPGAPVSDDKIYYVSSAQASIRKNEDPTKVTNAKLPAGAKVKRVRELGNVSQVEVIDNAGNSSVSVGQRYWTTTTNIAAAEAVTDTTLFWTSGAVTAKAGPGVGANASQLARETTFREVEKVTIGKTTYYRVVSEDGGTNYGWIDGKYVLKAAKDRADNFGWMGNTTWNSTVETADADTIKQIQSNRTGVNDRTSKDVYGKRNLGAVKGGGYMYSDSSRDITLEVEGNSEIEKKVNQVIYNELMKEGSWSSMNTYDGEIFTWGRGFASTGSLSVVLKELFKINPNYLSIFRQVGVDVVDGKLRVMDDAGKVLVDDSKKKGMDASRYIQKSVQLQSFFIELGEKKEFREDIARAQYRAIMMTAGKWPAYIVDKAAGTFAGEWNESTVGMMAHLGHWLPAAGWGTTDYSDTNGNMLSVIYKYILKTGEKAPSIGKKYEGGTFAWGAGYKIFDKLAHFGNPKGQAKTVFDAAYPTSDFNKDIEIKEIGGKKYAYLKGENKYLSGVVLLPDGDKFRVMTPLGNKDIKNYLVNGPEEVKK
ncbi:MAG: hypothetical protein U0176_15100 [Bacteroidia bacterium]